MEPTRDTRTDTQDPCRLLRLVVPSSTGHRSGSPQMPNASGSSISTTAVPHLRRRYMCMGCATDWWSFLLFATYSLAHNFCSWGISLLNFKSPSWLSPTRILEETRFNHLHELGSLEARVAGRLPSSDSLIYFQLPISFNDAAVVVDFCRYDEGQRRSLAACSSPATRCWWLRAG